MAYDVLGIPDAAWGGGAAAAGTGADIYAFIQNERNRQSMQRIYDILSNPAKLSQYVSRWYQPMGAAESKAISGDINAGWATSTGGATGGAMNQYIADALAKMESQRYQTAAGQAIQALQGSLSGVPGNLPMGNLGAILKQLAILRQIRPQQQDQSGQLPGITYPTPNGPGFSGGSEGFRTGYNDMNPDALTLPNVSMSTP